MKKKIVLILVVIAVIALTFSACFENAIVTASPANSAEMSVSADSRYFSLGWASGEDATTLFCTFPDATFSISMIPQELIVDETESTVSFATATISQKEGQLLFNDPSAVAPSRFASDEAESFYLKNMTQSAITSLYVTARIESENAESRTPQVVRVALFQKNDQGRYMLKGVLAADSQATVGYGEIVANASPETISSRPVDEFIELGSLNAGATAEFVALAWIDGTANNDTTEFDPLLINLAFSINE